MLGDFPISWLRLLSIWCGIQPATGLCITAVAAARRSRTSLLRTFRWWLAVVTVPQGNSSRGCVRWKGSVLDSVSLCIWLHPWLPVGFRRIMLTSNTFLFVLCLEFMPCVKWATQTVHSVSTQKADVIWTDCLFSGKRVSGLMWHLVIALMGKQDSVGMST